MFPNLLCEHEGVVSEQVPDQADAVLEDRERRGREREHVDSTTPPTHGAPIALAVHLLRSLLVERRVRGVNRGYKLIIDQVQDIDCYLL